MTGSLAARVAPDSTKGAVEIVGVVNIPEDGATSVLSTLAAPQILQWGSCDLHPF